MRNLIVMLLLVAPATSAFGQDDRTDAALRDAKTLVGHMQRFDTDGVASLLYTAPMEKMGADIMQMRRQAAKQDANLKSIGAKYLRFTLGKPTNPFSRPEGLFTLIPYSCVISGNGKAFQQDAFFLAFSNDSGANWTFLDGIATAKVPIESILPRQRPTTPASSPIRRTVESSRLTNRWSGRVMDKVPSPSNRARAAQLNR